MLHRRSVGDDSDTIPGRTITNACTWTRTLVRTQTDTQAHTSNNHLDVPHSNTQHAQPAARPYNSSITMGTVITTRTPIVN